MSEKSKNVIIGGLLILVTVLGGYIFYDKVMLNNNVNNSQNELENENNNNDESEKEEIIELSLDDDFVKKVFNVH